MSSYYRDYDQLYTDLIIEILEYFCTLSNENGPIKDRSILKFCEQHKNPEKNNEFIYQPFTVDKICKKLCEKNILTSIRNDGGLGLNNNYIYTPGNIDFFIKERERLKYYFNSMVYGFDYIYNMYRDLVVPLVWQTSKNDYYMGTGFKFLDGIITAKHCIEDAENIQIKGYSADELNQNKIFISDNPGVDIAFIQTNQIAEPILYTDEGEVLQEVLVLGYPRIPAFTDFLTAEKATISSKAEARITPTKGAITAYGNEYLSKIKAMLITARIKGGNSGGPVINENGCLVGVACQIPDYKSNDNEYYDDLGYGIAVPIEYATNIIRERKKILDIPNNFFKDYEL